MHFSFLFIISRLKVGKNIFFFVYQYVMSAYIKAMLLVCNSIVIGVQLINENEEISKLV